LPLSSRLTPPAKFRAEPRALFTATAAPPLRHPQRPSICPRFRLFLPQSTLLCFSASCRQVRPPAIPRRPHRADFFGTDGRENFLDFKTQIVIPSGLIPLFPHQSLVAPAFSRLCLFYSPTSPLAFPAQLFPKSFRGSVSRLE